MNKSIFLVFCLFLLAVPVFPSAEEFASESENPHVNLDEPQEAPKMNEQDMNKLRNRAMSCILLTKHKMYSIQKEVGATIETFSNKPAEQNSLYRKIFSTVLESCYMKISDDEAEKFMEEVQQREFKIESYDHLFLEFDLKNHSGKIGEVNVELTPTQAQLFKYAEEFDKVMKDKQEKEEEEQAEQEKLNPEDYEPKIAGISLKNSPATIKYFYLLAIFILFAGIIYWGLKSVLSGPVLAGDKKKLEKKSKKESKKAQ